MQIRAGFGLFFKLGLRNVIRVKKIRRIAWLALGGIIGLLSSCCSAVNLYVQSQGTQARIQQELSQRLGTPSKSGGSASPRGAGLKLSGITIPQTNSAVDTPIFWRRKHFGFGSASLHFSRRRLVIKEISLHRSRGGLDPERGRKMAGAYAPKRNRDGRRADRVRRKRLGTGTSEKCSGIRANSCASIRDFVLR